MKEDQYGRCGLYCGACGAEDCGGCGSDKIDQYVEGCKFRTCTAKRGLQFCCDCGDYPCAELDAFMHDEWPHHNTMAENLAYIKANGVQKWLTEQKKLYTCTDCGAKIVWYQKECKCGSALDAMEPPQHSHEQED